MARAVSLLFLLAGFAQPGFAGGEFEAQAQRWNRDRAGGTLETRVLAHDELASTGDVRALPLLRKAYAKPQDPEDQERYLIASIATARLHWQEDLAAYAAWRGAHHQDPDAWLWYKTLCVSVEDGDVESAAKAAREARSPWLRAAALEALAHARAPRALDVALEFLDALPRRRVERAVLVESAASVALAFASQRREARCRLLLTKLIRQLDESATLPRTRLVISRRLRVIFGTQELYLDSRPWLRRLLGGARKKPVEHGRYAAPRRTYFFGLETSGERIAYVIDTSSSMFAPITPSELAALKKIRRPARPGPTTGRGGGAPGSQRTPRGPDRLPWERIRTRYDAAKECLEFSLQGLAPEQRFTVIRFATDAGLLCVTGMVPATAKNIREVSSALDAGNEQSLGGSTNMHGGLHRAFKVRASGLAGMGEYVDRDAFLEGCDTIFVLSDGMPCADDWTPSWSAGLAPPSFFDDPDAHRFGTYWTQYQLCDDVERLDLFRKAEIDCIGIGSPNMPLLRRLAAIGHGKAVQVGGDGDPWSTVADLLRGKAPARAYVQSLRTAKDAEVRVGAAQALGRLRSIDVVPDLIDALDDRAVPVRRAAADALRRICDHEIPYDPNGDYDARSRAQRAWRTWFAANEAALRSRKAPR